MANYRVEKRQVMTEADVRLVDCDGCGSTAEVPRFSDATKPDDWLLVASGGEVHGVFCSRDCVRQWASGGTELTQIAREVFARATGAG